MSSTTRGKKFADLVQRIGPFGTSVLASADPYPAPSTEARRAARQMVGAVEVVGVGRVDRLAGLLDELRAADSNAVAAGVTKASKRRAS